MLPVIFRDLKSCLKSNTPAPKNLGKPRIKNPRYFNTNKEFQIKYQVMITEPKQKFLIYSETPKPDRVEYDQGFISALPVN